MKAFNNDPALKTQMLAEINEHIEADRFVRGHWFYPETKRGCFFGCLAQSEENPREKVSHRFGLDLVYCYITEKIYERIDDWRDFPRRAIEIVPVGFDFSTIWSPFFRALMIDEKYGVINFADNKEVVQRVADLFLVPWDEIDRGTASEVAAATISDWNFAAHDAANAAARAADYAAAAAAGASASDYTADEYGSTKDHSAWQWSILQKLITSHTTA